jgi:hypothetical protein
VKDLLQRARHEIIALRRSNEILSAQMEVVGVFAAALGFRGQNQGGAPDVAWELEREIAKIEQTEAQQGEHRGN